MVNAGLMAAVALPRLLLLPFSENLYGDAIPRVEMGERWMGHPHLITAFGDGAGQYGPLHLYLVGLATAFADREIAGGLVSLLAAVLTVVPLYRLGRRLAGWQAGLIACLALAVWGLHVQFSTTAASESVAILLMLSALSAFAAALDSGRQRDLVWAAVWLNLAEAVRYDAWMYPPVLAAAVLLTGSRASLSRRQLAGFVAMCLVFPVLWMLGNYEMHGDPMFPLDHINGEHSRWAATYAGFWRGLWLRAQGIGFWPVMALATLTPGVAAFGAVGLVAAWRERRSVRWVIVTLSVPVLYYAARTAIFADFVPLTRYMAVSLVLTLVFVWDGYGMVTRLWGSGRAGRLVRATAVLAVTVPLAIGWITFRRDGLVSNALRPLSPVTTNPRAVMVAAAFLRPTIASGAGLVVDTDEKTFLDLPLVFYGGRPEERAIRVRQPADLPRVERERPDYLVRLDGGSLVRQEGVTLSGRTLQLAGASYDELDGFSAPVHVYRRRP
jgi:4-amino-4-deoxy-L-arabinose transferase-like glycosyltransferase